MPGRKYISSYNTGMLNEWDYTPFSLYSACVFIHFNDCASFGKRLFIWKRTRETPKANKKESAHGEVPLNKMLPSCLCLMYFFLRLADTYMLSAHAIEKHIGYMFSHIKWRSGRLFSMVVACVRHHSHSTLNILCSFVPVEIYDGSMGSTYI